MENSNCYIFHKDLLHNVLSGAIGLDFLKSYPSLCLDIKVTNIFYGLYVLFLWLMTLGISEITENRNRQPNIFKYMYCSFFCSEALPSAML